MHLFLLLAVPLAYVYVLVLREQTSQNAAFTSIAVLKGALAFLLVLVPLLFVGRFVERPFSGPGVFVYTTITDFAIPVYLGFLLYLWFSRDAFSMTPEERMLSLGSFYAGLFGLQGVLDLFLRADYLGPYEIFHLPALRIVLMLVIPALYYHFTAETLWLRWLYLLLMLALPFAAGAAAMLVALNFVFAAIATTTVLFLGAWAVALFLAGSRSIRLT